MNYLNMILQNELFSLVFLPMIIFFSRILDVSLGTIRIIFISRGKRVLAPLLGFLKYLYGLLQSVR